MTHVVTQDEDVCKKIVGIWAEYLYAQISNHSFWDLLKLVVSCNCHSLCLWWSDTLWVTLWQGHDHFNSFWVVLDFTNENWEPLKPEPEFLTLYWEWIEFHRWKHLNTASHLNTGVFSVLFLFFCWHFSIYEGELTLFVFLPWEAFCRVSMWVCLI